MMVNKMEHVPYIALVAVVAIVGVVVLLQQPGNSTLSNSDHGILVGEAVKDVGSVCTSDADCPEDLVCDWNLTAIRSFVVSPNPSDKRCLPKSAQGENCASRTLGGSLTPAALYDWECQSGLICVRSPAYGNPACENQNTLEVGDSCLRDQQCQSGLCALSPNGEMICS